MACATPQRAKCIENEAAALVTRGGDDKDHKKDEQDCAHMRATLEPHAPNEAWIVDQMRRSHCNPDGTRMSVRDALKYEMDKPKFDDE